MSTTRIAVMPSLAGRAAYLALTKPDVSFLVVLTTAAGYYMGSRGPLELARLAHTVFGTTLLAAGTSALNHYLERGSDARMRRTASRPLPSGLLTPSQAFWFGAILAVAGTLYLGFGAGLLPRFLGVGSCVCFFGTYKPLKKSTHLATFVVAVSRATPS